MTVTIIVNGGAGVWRGDLRRAVAGVGRATEVGYEVLTSGGTSLDAVECAVVEMEDNPVFNAGTGSAPTLVGVVEMDAAIMDGASLRAGTVAAVTYPKNPIRLARLVMENSEHVTLSGKGADLFGKLMGVARIKHKPTRRKVLWRKAAPKALLDPLRRHLAAEYGLRSRVFNETVGALALDAFSNLAAASSTGGIFMKLPGRIGDTPVIGAGCYADQAGAATVTGVGEIAVRLVLSKFICDQMKDCHKNSQIAVEKAMHLLKGQLQVPMGGIAVDRRGRVGAAQTSKLMPWAFQSSGMKKPVCKPKAKIIRPRSK